MSMILRAHYELSNSISSSLNGWDIGNMCDSRSSIQWRLRGPVPNPSPDDGGRKRKQ